MTPPLPRITLMATAIAALISLIANATGGDDGITSTHEAHEAAEAKPIDPHDLGRLHAARLVSECHDDDERALMLLDIRARETSIRTRISPEAADQYVAGFEEDLRQYSDSLAGVILE